MAVASSPEVRIAMSSSLFAKVAQVVLGALFAASMIACGGTKQEAQSPTTTAAPAEVAPAAESAPEPAAPPATETAAASKTSDGSDIIPPFPSAGGGKKGAEKAGAAHPAAKSRSAGKKKPKKG